MNFESCRLLNCYETSKLYTMECLLIDLFAPMDFLEGHSLIRERSNEVHGTWYTVPCTWYTQPKLSQRLLSNKCQLQSIWRQLLSTYVRVCVWVVEYTYIHTCARIYISVLHLRMRNFLWPGLKCGFKTSGGL